MPAITVEKNKPRPRNAHVATREFAHQLRIIGLRTVYRVASHLGIDRPP